VYFLLASCEFQYEGKLKFLVYILISPFLLRNQVKMPLWMPVCDEMENFSVSTGKL